jgi:hypothetical protein
VPYGASLLAMLPFFLAVGAGVPLVFLCKPWQPDVLAIGVMLLWAALSVALWLVSLVLYLRWVPLVRR